MGFTDFFKRIRAKYKIEDPVKESKKIDFNKLESWTVKEKKEIENREREILALIKDKSSEFAKNLDEKIFVLKKIDLSNKKAEEKIKSIVNESRDKYVDSVENFKEDLIKLERERLEEFFIKVNSIFLSFEKKSFKNYQKANFLIGEEIVSTKKAVVDFSKYLTGVFNQNKDIINTLRMISFVKLKLKQVNEIDETLGRTNEGIKFLDKKIENLGKEKNKILESINEIRKSESYLDNLKQKEKLELSEKEIETEIQRLKSVVDFKALANFFHIFEDKMYIVKAHKENFEEEFRKDDGSRILNLLNGSKLNNDLINLKIGNINDKKKEIAKNKEEIKEDKTLGLLKKIDTLKTETEQLETEKLKDLKRCEKTRTNKEEAISSVRVELSKRDIEVLN